MIRSNSTPRRIQFEANDRLARLISLFAKYVSSTKSRFVENCVRLGILHVRLIRAGYVVVAINPITNEREPITMIEWDFIRPDYDEAVKEILGGQTGRKSDEEIELEREIDCIEVETDVASEEDSMSLQA